MNETNQQHIDSSRTAAQIEKNADLYERSPQFKFMVDNTVWLTDAEIHESMRVVGGDLFKGKY
jgi:hypothetical protein